jgi:hypothetical protein
MSRFSLNMELADSINNDWQEASTDALVLIPRPGTYTGTHPRAAHRTRNAVIKNVNGRQTVRIPVVAENRRLPLIVCSYRSPIYP